MKCACRLAGGCAYGALLALVLLALAAAALALALEVRRGARCSDLTRDLDALRRDMDALQGRAADHDALRRDVDDLKHRVIQEDIFSRLRAFEDESPAPCRCRPWRVHPRTGNERGGDGYERPLESEATLSLAAAAGDCLLGLCSSRPSGTVMRFTEEWIARRSPREYRMNQKRMNGEEAVEAKGLLEGGGERSEQWGLTSRARNPEAAMSRPSPGPGPVSILVALLVARCRLEPVTVHFQRLAPGN
ncbi:Protein of unknown function [Gryllus bimaculatus]|nr:Protein of unknown function [Gryllus bimaculatus]